jgi:hypothetical protein
MYILTLPILIVYLIIAGVKWNVKRGRGKGDFFQSNPKALPTDLSSNFFSGAAPGSFNCQIHLIFQFPLMIIKNVEVPLHSNLILATSERGISSIVKRH